MILEPNPTGLTPQDLMVANLSRGVKLADPFTTKESEKPLGFWKSALVSFVQDTVIGSTLFEALPYHFGRLAHIPSERDPDFNPYDLLTEDFAKQYPFMLEDFESGRVLDLPNYAAFDYYRQRKERDYELRGYLGRNSTLKNLVTMVPGQVLEAIILAGAGKAVGLGKKAAQIEKWVKTGNLVTRIGKAAVLGAIGNELQELGLYAAYPGRNVEELQAHLMAIGGGAVLAGTIPLLAAGGKRLRFRVSSAKIRRLQKQLASALDSPEWKAGANEITQILDDDRTLLQSLLQDAPNGEPRTVVVLDHPETRGLLSQVKKKWGDDLVVGTHPQQEMVDWLLQLKELDESLTKVAPAQMKNLTAQYAEVLSAFAPGRRLAKQPSLVARKAGRLFFDETRLTQEMIESPITHAVKASAESIRWIYDNWRDTAILRINKALDGHLKGKSGPLVYTFADGETVRIRSRWGRHKFGRAIVDYLRRFAEYKRHHGEAPEAPKAVVRAAAAVRRYMHLMGDEAIQVRLMTDIDPKRIYLPRRWKQWVIALRRNEFTRRLIAQWRKNREIDFDTGVRIDPEGRTLVSEVVEYNRRGQLEGRGLTKEDRAAIGELSETGKITEITEGSLRQQLGDDVLRRYHEEVEIYFDRAAESTADTLTGIENSHGAETGMAGGAVFNNRILKVDETAFADFLDDDIFRAIGFYHRQTSGRIASRLSIKRSIDEWYPVVRKLTGKNLIKEAYDPELILEAVKRDYQQWLDVGAKLNNSRLQNAVESARDMTGDILRAKLDELHGVPAFPNNAAAFAGWRLWLKRNSMRFPYMAYLGKMTVSAIPDMAALTFYARLSPRRHAMILRALNLFKQVPLRGVEGLDVALNDAMRSMRSLNLGDIGDLSDARQFGPGLKGRFLQYTDAGMDWMTRKFSSLTLMNRWNTNMKRTAAHMVTGVVIDAARRMKKAAQFMAEGMDQKAAIHKASLSGKDAARLNRLGINGDRATRLMDMLYEYGVDRHGNRPWAGDRAAFDNFKRRIFPELNTWWRKDRDLFETFTGAVNSEVLNLIVEPKLLSRPLMNARYMGRVINQFQSFAYSWGNQFAVMAAQRPAIERAQYATWAILFGAMSDAIHSHLSGRRSFDETAELWQEKPLGMVYAAVDRCGMTGWLARPLGWAEHTPYGPAKVFGVRETSSMYAQTLELPGLAGPLVDYTNRLLENMQRGLVQGQWDERTLHNFRVLMPFQNLWFVQGAERFLEDAGLVEPYRR